MSTEPEREVLAAGAVVVRHEPPGSTNLGNVRVLIVHRPRYDDWSFPKGKLYPGEHPLAAAVREVDEETGIATVLRAPLPSTRYRLGNGTWKSVRYWQAAVRVSEPDRFRPNKEVDQRVWLPVDAARQRLTHAHDRNLLDQLFPPTTPLILLRHAGALARDAWRHADLDRPLTPDGIREAHKLVAILAAFGAELVVSSPATRCLDTVRPYVDVSGARLVVDPGLTEQASAEQIQPAIARARATSRPVVVCVHRPTLPAISAALGIDPVALDPAELIVLHRAASADRDPNKHDTVENGAGYRATERHHPAGH